jgi:hypothetical protein
MQGVFDKVINEVYECKDLESCKQLVIDVITHSKINAYDKAKILLTTRNQEDLAGLQQYITNSYFQYNGLKVI